MTQITHETQKAKLLILELPDDAVDVKLGFYGYTLNYTLHGSPDCKTIPEGYTYIGKCADIGEEQCREIVDVWKYNFPNRENIYANYKNEKLYCTTALDSFSSLLEHLGIVVMNKYGCDPMQWRKVEGEPVQERLQKHTEWFEENKKIKNWHVCIIKK